MNFFEIIGLALVITIVFHLGIHWLISWMSSRAVAKALRGDTPRAKLMPESLFVIQMNDLQVSCHRPDGTIECVRWDDLQRVSVLTTNDGPWAPDVFWLLHGEHGGCLIPQGATGDTELLERLQQLPGFDNKVFMNAMGSTEEAIFTCWERQTKLHTPS